MNADHFVISKYRSQHEKKNIFFSGQRRTTVLKGRPTTTLLS